MRLEKIKLAGFKSFVDPTTVLFPSNLVGIVGPNGCGKSNVIDAVRWVMGESSAKMLRGESMADVIFNGSTSRKPVGQASIELVFDNASGRAGGEYAGFAQIAVKRLVSRDGQSNYFLNGSKCRRRDIQDLFLGTGLGPRSYAIIEQGMISRFIEAKPAELRLFIEEAAGISKYKERRRETETRIRHTRDNLDRLNDLREEVTAQLAKLERQAATAERYQRYKAEERRLSAELKALRWRELDEDVGQRDRKLAEQENGLEAEIARQRRLEADVETQRDAYSEATEAFNKVQGRFYGVGSEIARLEQAIGFATETRARQESELGRTARELEEIRGHRERDAERLEELVLVLEDEEPALEEAEEARDAAAERLSALESELRVCEADHERAGREVTEPAGLAQTERSRINGIEQVLARDAQRRERVAAELEGIDPSALEERVEALAERADGIEEQLDAAREEQGRVTTVLKEIDDESRTLSDRLDGARTELQGARGRASSLTALQEAALSDVDERLAAWLKARGLDAAPKIVDRIQVEAGWERAVEVVLGERLGATCIESIGAVEPPLPDGLALYQPNPGDHRALGGLAAKVSAPWDLSALLAGVDLAGDLDEALARRAALAPQQTLVTPDGVLVGRDWLLMPGSSQALGGVLQRADELEALNERIEELEDGVQALAGEREHLRERRLSAESSRERVTEIIAGESRELSTVQADLSGARTRLEHLEERRDALEQERDELDGRHQDALCDIEEARERLHAALERAEACSDERDRLAERRDRLRGEVEGLRIAEREAGRNAQQLQIGIGARRTERDALATSLKRSEERFTQLSERREALSEELEGSLEPIDDQKERLETALGERVEVDAELAAARDRLEALDQGMRGQEQERQRIEQAIAERHRLMDRERLERQEKLVHRRNIEEELKLMETKAELLLQALDPVASVDAWQEQLGKVEARIQRLGNINLAAIDEFEEQSERKRYLDEQHDDVSGSLETLEAAIRKIDRETRTRFKETYDQVDAGIKQLFPRLFGGGHAYLELTDDDLLETGVTIMARPPGKRNSSIHLLSGGEKALTAVALVFAIFQLNPAPFCMLDEVDAPLDDANVGRFCSMVKSMSDQVQFIFITHNKVTMEISDQLCGVTMHEPGCSRLVSVDVEEAARMVAS